VALGTQQTAAAEVDLPRLDRVVSAIASAVLYRLFIRKAMHQWQVYPEFMLPMPSLTDGTLDEHNRRLRDIIRTVPFTEHAVPEPSVFRCRSYSIGGETMFQFLFYGGAAVTVVPLQKPGSLAVAG
jgi:hypothetical protein